MAFSTASKANSKALLIARQAKVLLSAYRRDDLADPDGFVAQLGVVLEDYPDAVIIAVTDPRTGLQRRSKWLPTIAEVVEACEAEQVAMATRERYASLPPPVPYRPALYLRDDSLGRRANVFVPPDAPQYARLCEVIKNADPADWKYDPQGRPGIWIAANLIDQPRPKGFRHVTEEIQEMLEPKSEAAE